MSKCIVCLTEFVPNERSECSYCAAEKRAAEALRKELKQPPILTNENYFSHEAEAHYMGSTQFKRFMECESQALAIIRGEFGTETSTALLVGSYVDAYFSGELDLFRGRHPDIFTRQGTLKSDFQQAEQIIKRIERDPQFMEAVSGSSQSILTGEIEGVPIKIKVDSLLPDRIVDMKIMRDMADAYDKENREWRPFWKAWGYDYQGAIYREIVRQNTGKLLPFGLAVATKEKPEPDIDLLTLPAPALDEALEIVKASIVYYDGLKKGLYPPERCGKCAYCRSTKVLKGWREVEC